MTFGPLISAEALAGSAGDFRLLDARRGPDYAAGHLEGALLADLEVHLSSAAAPGFDPARGGRHPLPAPAVWAAQLAAWGIGRGTSVVVYDGASGANAACRAWWMLRAVGHERVAVLDGGLAAARAAGMTVTQVAPPPPAALPPYPVDDWSLPRVEIEAVARRARDSRWKVLDVRSRERWLGQTEPLDPVPGRIPGTVNLPYGENLRADGCFESSDVLRRKYQQLLGGVAPDHLVVHCGSGVTACHTLLALELAGFEGAALYVGSYSEWCRSGRPIDRG